jgi:hypothetical protein
VAWIRRVRTASGATAVQIAEYGGGRRKVVAHVGSARTEAELGILFERTREMLADPAQGAFDHDLPKRPSTTGPDTEQPLTTYAQARGCLARWWQVQGSNLRRLSRRSYRPSAFSTDAGTPPA